MQRLSRDFLDAALGVAVLAAAMALSIGALAGPVRGPMTGPVLVVAPPWGQGALAVVRAAGGVPLGPATAPFATLASFPAGTKPADLGDLGAWAVRDGGLLGAICGV